jgi:hypothetical protein
VRQIKASISYKDISTPWGELLGSTVSQVSIEAADAAEFAQAAGIIADQLPKYVGPRNAQPAPREVEAHVVN